MMDINSVIRLSVDKCIAIYDEVTTEIHNLDENGSIYGVVPKALIIKYGKGSLEKDDFILRDILNTWYYCDGDIKETEENVKPVKEPISGMFFAEASAEFMLDEEGKYVYLNYYFGPRYARGIRYMLEEQGDLVRFGKEETLWVS